MEVENSLELLNTASQQKHKHDINPLPYYNDVSRLLQRYEGLK